MSKICLVLLSVFAAWVGVERRAEAACQLDCAPGVCVGNGAGSQCQCGLTLCGAGQICSTANNCCTETVTTCAGVQCGLVPKACGGILDCSANTCIAPSTCGGGGTPNLCACTETVTTCTGRCGIVPKTCGGTLNCSGNVCAAGTSCNAQFVCAAACVPTTCAAENKNCGTIANGCGGTIACGNCAAGNLCLGNVCGMPTLHTYRFAAGSLVIPMDQCYNPDYGPTTAPNNNGTSCVAGTPPTCYTTNAYQGGNVRLPFGMLYLLAQNHIPVSVILHPFKSGMIDDDFFVTPPPGSTVPTVSKLSRSGAAYAIDPTQLSCGTNTVHYGGMPFVIDAAFADQALKLIAQGSSQTFAHGTTFDEVPLHVINYGFDAPVLATLASRPRPVGISGAPLDTYFDESGIPDVCPPNTTFTYVNSNGAGGYTYTWPQAALGPHPGCPGGVCNSLTYTPAGGAVEKILSVVWTSQGQMGGWSEVGPWLQADGTALVVADGTGWEANPDNKLGGNMFVAQNGAQRGPYCATVAVNGNNRWAVPGPANGTFPASNIYLQIGDMDLFTHGGGGGDGSAYGFVNPTAATNVHTLVSNDDTYYSAVTGHPLVSGAQVPGDVVYLGSLNSWHGGARNKDAGLHIMYNTLLVGGDGGGSGGPQPPPPVLSDIEMTRSSPVGKVSGEIYLGTFDWQVPKDPGLGGAVLVDPPKTIYPFMTGHFREYKSTIGNGSLKCDPAVAGAICSWDTASLIKPWAQRNVFIGTKTSGVYNLVTAGSQAGDATVAYIAAQIGTRLGGVDYGTAAVIEAKGDGSLVTIANAKTRPTIAYFGARDGMLHAVCAQSAGCYGSYPQGSELWAFIPPGVKAQIAAARAAGDFSQVNIGGAVRVGDFQDTFAGGAATYRTVLIAGTRESGHVFALDISNPDPANFNQDGFKLLWEQDGTDVNTSVTSIRMGATRGASLGRKGNTAFAVVTSGLATGTGLNTHVLRLSDGKVLAVDQKVYSRAIPLPGGSSGSLPNDTPALATLYDADNSGDDETVLVADFEGVVRKMTLNASGTFVAGQTGTLFDTATGRCNSGQTCQPVGVSATLGKLGSGQVAAFIATGGADWARSASVQSYAFGFNVPATGGSVAVQPSIFSRTLGTVQPPAGPPPANLVLDFPLRVYSQLTISGTDLYALGTTISVGPINQLIQPIMFPGTYGQVLRWGGLDQTIDTNATLYVTQGTNFSAGAGSVLQLNNAGGQGTLAIVGTANSIRIAAPVSSERNGALAIQLQPTGQRPFNVMTWFDLAN